MYNAVLKEEFIKTQTSVSVRTAYKHLFEAIEKFEREWGADICTRTPEELRPVMDDILGVTRYGNRMRTGLLKKYALWCMENNVPGACKGVFEVDLSNVSKMRTQTVKNPAHLQAYLNVLFGPEKDEGTDNALRCFFWLAYGGLLEEDAIKVTAKDVDLVNMVFRFNGEEYPIYREAVPCFRNCATLTQFALKYRNGTVYKDRCLGDSLLRRTSFPDKDIVGIRSQVSKAVTTAYKSGKTDICLSYFKAWLSGVFYRTYIAESMGIAPDFTNPVAKLMQNISYSLDNTRASISSYRNYKAKWYLNDYEQWKTTLIV